jgi:S-adenosylmethionine synthetase
MMVVGHYQGQAVADQAVEIVERKGIGHPDSICDAVAEAVSVALCRAYRECCGRVLHHNIDKGLLVAGRVDLQFGGGRVLQPMELIVGDRATDSWCGREIPVLDIAMAAIQQWFRDHLPRIDPQRHLRCRPVLAPGSAELADIFARPGKLPGANDTSAAVGYWPLSPTEALVLELDAYLSSAAFKEKHQDCGEDIKIMALRQGHHLEMTIAMPLLAGMVGSETAYFSRKAELSALLNDFLARFPSSHTVHLNALDVPGRGLDGVYLSLLGTSAESADSGQVGRGNRINGLISLNRPLGTEAAAGKNPVSHIGKIYSVLAQQAARRIQENIAGVREAYVWLLSRIGEPIDRPVMVSAQLVLMRGCELQDVRVRAQELLEEALGGIERLCEQLSQGAVAVC